MAFTLPTELNYGDGSMKGLLRVGTFSKGAVSQVLSGANIRFGIVFMARHTENLNGFKIQLDANGGTGGTAVAELYAVDANGRPTGSVLATVTFAPTTNALNTGTFSAAYAVTSGTAYALVFKNTDGTPGTNNFRFKSMDLDMWTGYAGLWSTDATNYLVGGYPAAPIVLTYATSGDEGPYCSTLTGAGNPDQSLYNVSGSRVARNAIKFVPTRDLDLWKVAFMFRSKTGSPTFEIQGEVCSASASLSVSDFTFNAVNAASGIWGACHWGTPYRLTGGTTYYIGVSPVGANAGDASNLVTLQSYLSPIAPGTQGEILDSYCSSGATVSWTQATSLKAFQMELHCEIPASAGSSASYTVGPGFLGSRTL